MSDTAPDRKVTFEQIQYVQQCIEKCMQLYMAADEIVSFLQKSSNIEPTFTRLVLQKLEEQNAEFFRAYYLRVKVKDQVIMFNRLLEQQILQAQLQHSWMQPVPPFLLQRPGLPFLPPSSLPPGTSMPPPALPTSFTAAMAASANPCGMLGQAGPSAAAAAAPSTQQQLQGQQQPCAATSTPMVVTTQEQQQQFQQQFNQHLQQHVQQHLQQHLQQQQQQQLPAGAWPVPFGPQPGAMQLPGLGGLPGLPYPFMPTPAVLAAAAAAAAAGGGARLVAHTASTSTGGTPVAAAASNSRGCAGSTADKLGAWGLGGAGSTMSAGEAAAGAAASAVAAIVPSQPSAAAELQQCRSQQEQQQQSGQTAALTQQVSMFLENATAAGAAAAQQQELAAATAAQVIGSSMGMLNSRSCAMLDAAEQMPPMTKPFSFSDLNALDIPGQLTGELGDLSGLGDEGEPGGPGGPDSLGGLFGGPSGEGALEGSRGSSGAGGGGGGQGVQVQGMPAGFTLPELGQFDMVADMLAEPDSTTERLG